MGINSNSLPATQPLKMKNLKRALLKYINGLTVSSNDGSNQGLASKTSLLMKKKRWRSIKKVVPAPHTKPTKQKWVQLAGHQDSFAVGEEGTILKKLSENENDVFSELMCDHLRPFVPHYSGTVTVESEQYVEMEDLLRGFSNPCVMDCKMGTRTYLETELTKANQQPRPDMYEKMIKIDPNAPTAEEHAAGAVTKPRYMQFRESLSSSTTLGFRIEGIKNSDGKALIKFANCKELNEVSTAIGDFTNLSRCILQQYLARLKDLHATCLKSHLFSTHEFIGSSLLFVHDNEKANVWMIDFGKTMLLPENMTITHDSEWKRGNHEDGYLTGLKNIIEIFECLLANA
ncbi:inositol-trisphosphate 3-kinase A-like [Watersipora subatra]|uniref:inositol-trisphosphate 3-kinase A-like n=1 Tax=Watersipora subatra TaxID=2589382 RepID=UPI00355C3027